jgi:hypothetical protein
MTDQVRGEGKKLEDSDRLVGHRVVVKWRSGVCCAAVAPTIERRTR